MNLNDRCRVSVDDLFNSDFGHEYFVEGLGIIVLAVLDEVRGNCKTTIVYYRRTRAEKMNYLLHKE